MPFGSDDTNQTPGQEEDSFRAVGFDGDSPLDDNWRNAATGKNDAKRGSLLGRREAAASKAKKGELAATKDSKGSKNGLGAAKDAEKSGSEGFTNKVTGAAAKTVPGGRLIANQAKKLGPLGVIIMILMGIVGIFSISQSLAPFGLIANGLDQFNVLRTSMNKRSHYYQRFMLSSGTNESVTRVSVFGKEKFNIKSRLESKLRKNDIYYFEEGGVRFLTFEDPDTHITYGIAANESDASRIPDMVTDSKTGRTFEISTDRKVVLDDALALSSNFDTNLDKGTRTLKGHIAGWFDSLSEKLHARLKNSRNRFKNTTDVDDDDDVIKAARTGGLDEDADSADVRKVLQDDYEEDSGRDRTDRDIHEIDEGDTSLHKGDSDTSHIETSLTNRARAAVAALGQTAGIICGALKAFAAINMVIAAIHVANVINYVTGFLESIQKIQAGDGGSQLHYYMNSLSEKGTTYDGDGNVYRTGTSSLQSEAWNQFFSDGSVKVDPNDPMALKFNKDYVATRSVKNAGGELAAAIDKFGSATAAYNACLGIDLGTNLTMGIIDAALVIGAAFTGGLTAVIATIKDLFADIIKTATLTAIMAGLQLAISALVPHVAQWLAMDLIANMAGEDAAHAINSGFNMYSGRQMQYSSGKPGTKEQVMAQYRATQEVIASEAEFERKTRSPFDPTSKYTFFGSIVNSLTPIAMTMSAPLTAISNTAGLVGKAFGNLLPTAAAAGETEFETSINYDCPSLSSLDLIGDAYCNPYFVSDYSTISYTPGEVFDVVALDSMGRSNGNFDIEHAEEHEGNPQIIEKSEMAKWVVACAARDSQFGTADMNIAAYVSGAIDTGSNGLDVILGTGIGVVPIVGDLYQAASAITEASNHGWVTGENCTKDEYKFYSRYSEDQRMLESVGAISKSAVTAFLEEHEKKYPVDNSTEGTIARYSGLTVEQVNTTLGLMEYINYIANYDPTNLGPLPVQEKVDEGIVVKEGVLAEYVTLPDVIVSNKVLYFDSRFNATFSA